MGAVAASHSLGKGRRSRSGSRGEEQRPCIGSNPQQHSSGMGSSCISLAQLLPDMETLRGDVAYTAGSIPRGLQFLPCRKPGADISMLLLANVSTQLVTSQPCQRVHPGQPFPPLPRGSSFQCLTCIFLAEIKVH